MYYFIAGEMNKMKIIESISLFRVIGRNSNNYADMKNVYK